jgi:hypothetical protein
MPDPITAIAGFKAAIDLLRSALGAAKDAKDLLPDSTRKDAVSQSLEEADKAARLAEVQVAQSLGYKLCQCTFPPQIMLSQGHDPKATFLNEAEYFKCEKCGREDPSAAMRRRSLV